jgi:hypothetical protein
MPENLLEFYAATTDADPAADGRHPSQAVEKLTQPGTEVRYCRSILVSIEKTCFVLLEANSLDDVLETMRLADVACDRVSPGANHPVPAGVTGVHVVAVGGSGISCCEGSPTPAGSARRSPPTCRSRHRRRRCTSRSAVTGRPFSRSRTSPRVLTATVTARWEAAAPQTSGRSRAPVPTQRPKARRRWHRVWQPPAAAAAVRARSLPAVLRATEMGTAREATRH